MAEVGLLAAFRSMDQLNVADKITCPETVCTSQVDGFVCIYRISVPSLSPDENINKAGFVRLMQLTRQISGCKPDKMLGLHNKNSGHRQQVAGQRTASLNCPLNQRGYQPRRFPSSHPGKEESN
jgi:hypothetical protein